MQYKIQNGAVYYDGEMVLENVDIEINNGEKIAIVGRNGCGKTTLLKAIMGEVELNEGTGETPFRVIKTGAPEISYLRQIPFEDENIPMEQEIRKVFSHLIEMEEQIQVLANKLIDKSDEKSILTYTNLNDRFIALGGTTYKKEYKTMIRKFGFTEQDEKKPVKDFSGGQRTKISFIKMLLSKPDILLLDEPTNHLDIQTIEWLETYLKSYKSTLVIVSHDRMFLDRIVNKVYEIEYGESKCYKGNFTEFERQKKENYLKQLKDHERQQEEIARLTRLIERFRYKATKAKMVQSKIKLLERMKIIYAPDKADNKTYKTNFQPRFASSRQVLNVNNLEIGYIAPLAKLSFSLERGQRLGIFGRNGVGKSTLLKTLMGKISAISGTFQFGFNTQVAYFDQQLAQINGEQTIFELFASAYPHLNDLQVRNALGAFQFSGEDVFRPVSTLSGGEKVRLTLCKILYSCPNVLVLDEPTNHLDIVGKQTIEDLLINYEGTIIFVSHDRYFVSKIADRLLVFENKNACFYDCNYTEYEQKRQNEVVTQKIEQVERVKSAPKGYTTPKKELDKKKRRVERLEFLITECEDKAKPLNQQMLLPEVYSNYQKVLEIQGELEQIKLKQAEYEEEWAMLIEQIEQAENN